MKKIIYLCLLLFTFSRASAQHQDSLRAGTLHDTLILRGDYLRTNAMNPDSLRVPDLSPDELIRIADSLRADSIRLASTVTGIASFYSANLDGSKTSTGEIFRNSKMTAASNFFKLNTWVRVTNLKNNKSIIVRINDRMHPRMKKQGRVVDLTRTAAKKLDFIKSGLTRVKVEIVDEGTIE